MRVLVADDQRVVREGLATIVASLPGMEVVGLAANGQEAVALTETHRPDVVLMDLRMPTMDGAEATAAIRAAYPDTQVVVLTTYADDQSIIAALSAGATGYLTKDATRDDIRRALEAAAAGQSVLDPAVQAKLIQAAQAGAPRDEQTGAPVAAARRAHRAGSRGAQSDRPGPVQHRDRRRAICRRGHRQDARQPHLRQDGQPGSHPGGGLRPPPRIGRIAVGRARHQPLWRFSVFASGFWARFVFWARL